MPKGIEENCYCNHYYQYNQQPSNHLVLELYINFHYLLTFLLTLIVLGHHLVILLLVHYELL